jgi:hypothetical protein
MGRPRRSRRLKSCTQTFFFSIVAWGFCCRSPHNPPTPADCEAAARYPLLLVIPGECLPARAHCGRQVLRAHSMHPLVQLTQTPCMRTHLYAHEAPWPFFSRSFVSRVPYRLACDRQTARMPCVMGTRF